MQRREFIKQSGKIVGELLSGAIMGSFSGCKLGDLHEFYSCDTVTLSNGITCSIYKMVVNVGASGTGHDSARSSEPCVIKESNTYKMWFHGTAAGTAQIFYAESF